MRSDRLGETLLPKRLALPIFASDALSSVAYAPDEIFLTLAIAGGAFATTHSWQIGLGVVFVMLVVVASYRQNVRAYPSGGGDYEVATVNLGPKAGLTVASSLLVDYVLTVAVSVSSGVQNAGAALTFIRGHEMPVAVGLVVLLTAMNLRGVRESGKAFAVPVYAFMLGIIGMAAFGFLRAATGTLPQAASAQYDLVPEQAGSNLAGFAMLFLLLRAFSSGCAALTGVEAISNGVPAFKKPKSRNAADDPPAHGGHRRDHADVDHHADPDDRHPLRREPGHPAHAQRQAGRRQLRPGDDHRRSCPTRSSPASPSASSSSRSSPASS